MINKFKHISLILIFILTSCDDYLDIKPVGLIIPKSVEEYRSFLSSAYVSEKNYKVLTTYRTDELDLYNNAQGVEQYKDIFIWNDENPDSSVIAFSYASFYTTIFYVNHIIENLPDIEGNLTEKEQLIGEAYALRAMQYFELVNLYAKPYDSVTAATDLGVPITTKYDSEKNYPRQTIEKVYELILSDIERAENYLNIEKQELGINYRFSKISIKSLKARVYLYQNNWQEAINAASEALMIKSDLMDLNSDTSIMPSEYNSVESILALETVASFDLVKNATISEDLINTYEQVTDLRFAIYFKANADGSYSSRKNSDHKFKSSYRVAELYLTTAESFAQLGKLKDACKILYQFTEKRYSTLKWNYYKKRVNTLDKDALINEILEERRREFAIEGQRWNDLRRTTQQTIIKTFDGITYILEQNDRRYVIPFPTDAVINNPNL